MVSMEPPAPNAQRKVQDAGAKGKGPLSPLVSMGGTVSNARYLREFLAGKTQRVYVSGLAIIWLNHFSSLPISSAPHGHLCIGNLPPRVRGNPNSWPLPGTTAVCLQRETKRGAPFWHGCRFLFLARMGVLFARGEFSCTVASLLLFDCNACLEPRSWHAGPRV